MSEYIIHGALPLRGSIRVQGAKNSVLPILAATLLCSEGIVCLQDVPNLSDVYVCLSMLEALGCTVSQYENTAEINTSCVTFAPLRQPDCSMMRSSVLFLGPMLARFGRAELYFPGGCLLGERPIDLHISALQQMGTVFSPDREKIIATCPDGLHGADILLSYPSVGATENILMAASLAKGETKLYNYAKEPEIDDLIDALCLMGAKIVKQRERILIEGVGQLHGCEKTIMPDRIAAYTFLAAALATDGEITLTNFNEKTLAVPLEILAAAGGAICRRKGEITISRSGPFILPVGAFSSGPYPAFPTDAGAITLALLSLAQGQSVFTETVFSDRFKVVGELQKFGADIHVKGSRAHISGVKELHGCRAAAVDLRAGAALLVAALSAQGKSIIEGSAYIERGYEDIVFLLRSVGADITEN